jgi:Domain of unknown function (DUF4189)
MTMIAHRRRFTAAVAGMATAVALIVALAPAVGADGNHGAIAYSSNGSWGRAWDYPTVASAQATAISNCGYTDCKALTSFTDCGAVAADGHAFQGGVGATLSAAMHDARTKLGGGYIDTWACN